MDSVKIEQVNSSGQSKKSGKNKHHGKKNTRPTPSPTPSSPLPPISPVLTESPVVLKEEEKPKEALLLQLPVKTTDSVAKSREKSCEKETKSVTVASPTLISPAKNESESVSMSPTSDMKQNSDAKQAKAGQKKAGKKSQKEKSPKLSTSSSHEDTSISKSHPVTTAVTDISPQTELVTSLTPTKLVEPPASVTPVVTALSVLGNDTAASHDKQQGLTAEGQTKGRQSVSPGPPSSSKNKRKKNKSSSEEPKSPVTVTKEVEEKKVSPQPSTLVSDIKQIREQISQTLVSITFESLSPKPIIINSRSFIPDQVPALQTLYSPYPIILSNAAPRTSNIHRLS